MYRRDPLLCAKDYRDNAGNRAWLSYPTAKGEVRLPVSDPYEEIYLLKDVAYRMVDPEWLAPKSKALTIDQDRPTSGGPWDKYCSYLMQAKNFHDHLRTNFHPESYQFYGTDLDSPDRIKFTSRAYSPLSKDHFTQENLRFVNKWGFRTYVDQRDWPLYDEKAAEAIVTLELPAGKGDGTVPDSSGKVLPIGEDRTTKIGTMEGSWFEIGHQDIYGTQRAQEVVFICIWNLVQKYINDQVGPTKACYDPEKEEP